MAMVVTEVDRPEDVRLIRAYLLPGERIEAVLSDVERGKPDADEILWITD
jgi:hypothetical protein